MYVCNTGFSFQKNVALHFLQCTLSSIFLCCRCKLTCNKNAMSEENENSQLNAKTPEHFFNLFTFPLFSLCIWFRIATFFVTSVCFVFLFLFIFFRFRFAFLHMQYRASVSMSRVWRPKRYCNTVASCNSYAFSHSKITRTRIRPNGLHHFSCSSALAAAAASRASVSLTV